MSRSPIRYFDRCTGFLETEKVYGERWLRFTYENPIGRGLLWLLVRRALFSKYYGWKMRKKISSHKVLPFIVDYDLNADEFLRSPFEYKTFNEFFIRELKPGARPIKGDDRIAVFPADGRHLAFPDVDRAEGFYVKGAKFSLASLLADEALAAEFAGGAMLISRLCPVDYHRFHFPVAGVPGESREINGWLYSVSPIALRRNLRYLVENKREVTRIESPEFGSVLMVEVGATNVGTIRSTFVPGRAMAKGTEKGYFAFGGSCLITIFQAGRIQIDADIAEQSRQQIETYARMGDRLGEARR